MRKFEQSNKIKNYFKHAHSCRKLSALDFELFNSEHSPKLQDAWEASDASQDHEVPKENAWNALGGPIESRTDLGRYRQIKIRSECANCPEECSLTGNLVVINERERWSDTFLFKVHIQSTQTHLN